MSEEELGRLSSAQAAVAAAAATRAAQESAARAMAEAAAMKEAQARAATAAATDAAREREAGTVAAAQAAAAKAPGYAGYIQDQFNKYEADVNKTLATIDANVSQYNSIVKGDEWGDYDWSKYEGGKQQYIADMTYQKNIRPTIKSEYEANKANIKAFLAAPKGKTVASYVTPSGAKYPITQLGREAAFTEANKDLATAIKSDKYVVTYTINGKTEKKTFTTKQQADNFIDSLPSAKTDTSWIYTTPKGAQSTGGAKGLTILGVTFEDRSALRGKEAKPLDLDEVATNIGKVGEAYENIFKSATKSAEVTAEKLHGLSPGADVFRLPVKAGVGAFNAATFIIRPAEWAGAANLITALMTPEKGETPTEYRNRITALIEGDIADPAERERITNQLISVMPQTPISTTDIETAKAVREAFAKSIVNDPAGFVAQVAGGFLGGYIVGDVIQNIPQIKKAISRLNIEQRMWDKITPIDEVPLKEAGDIAPFQGGKYDSSNVALTDNYNGPVLWTRGTWNKMNAWKEDPLHLGGTAVIALREVGTKNVVGYMTWEEAVKTTGGIPELFGLMGIINLPNGTKVYAEPGFATISLNQLDAKTLQVVITKLEAPTLQKAITKLDETTLHKLDTKTLLTMLPQLDFKTIQDVVPKLDDATIQKMALSQALEPSQIQELVQSLTVEQTQKFVQNLSLAQLEVVTPMLTTVQITELTKKLPPLKRDIFRKALEKRRPSDEKDKFTVKFTDINNRSETLNVKANSFREAYLRAANIAKWHGLRHIVEITRRGKSTS